MTAEAKLRLQQLLADFEESATEIRQAWIVMYDDPSHETVERFGQAFNRYLTINSAIKTLAIATVLRDRSD